MALRTLLFSSDERTAQILARHLGEFDLAPVVCPDIFSALENLGRVHFDGIVADWNDDPEATFLTKRAKETELNRMATVLAVVRDDVDVARAYEAGAKAVLLQPLDGAEIRDALAKMRAFMVERAGPADSETADTPLDPPSSQSNEEEVLPIASQIPQIFLGLPQGEQHDGPVSKSESPLLVVRRSKPVRVALVVGVVIALFPIALRLMFAVAPLITKAENALRSVGKNAREQNESEIKGPVDNAFDGANVASSPSGRVRVVVNYALLHDAVTRLPLRRTGLPDFPLHADKPDVPVRLPIRMRIPDSIKRSAPIESAHPVEAKLTPVMVVVVEPVPVSEESARERLEYIVEPSYPKEALGSRIQGSVTLQALIGRDGSVRELHLIDGSFALVRAAVQAVKQWHFQPYLVNGRSLETQTILTIDFRLPVASGAAPGESR